MPVAGAIEGRFFATRGCEISDYAEFPEPWKGGTSTDDAFESVWNFATRGSKVIKEESCEKQLK